MAIDLTKPVDQILKVATKRIMAENLPEMETLAVFTDKGVVAYTDDVKAQFNTSSGAKIKKEWIKYIANHFNENKLIIGRVFPFDTATIVACRAGEAPSVFNSYLELDPRTNLFVLYHELGHVVDRKYLMGDPYKREDFADTFASLMYSRDFGADADIFNYAPYTFAYNAFKKFQDNLPGMYYSSSVILAAQRVCEEINISNISAAEASVLSDKIVRVYSTPKRKRLSVYNEFNNLSKSGNSINVAVIKTMLKTKCFDTYRAGALVLKSLAFKNDMEFVKNSQLFASIVCYKALKSIKNRKENDDNIKGIILNPVDAIDAERGINGVKEIVRKFKSRKF